MFEPFFTLRNGKYSFVLSLSPSREKEEHWWKPWRKIMSGVGIEPLTFTGQTSTLTTKPRGFLDMRYNLLSSCSSCLAAKLKHGCFLAVLNVHRPPAEHQYTLSCITLKPTKKMNARVHMLSSIFICARKQVAYYGFWRRLEVHTTVQMAIQASRLVKNCPDTLGE